MLFDSAIFFVFLTMVVVAYWLLPWRRQNLFLLAASYFFYGWWNWHFLFLMAGSTVMDYFIAKRIARCSDANRRRAMLIFSLVLNLSLLGIFKYFNFFVDSFAAGLHALGVEHVSLPVLRILLPPGISFYTFQAIAYVVDVYQRKMEPSESLLDYALFISLFPHLIAGPIQRPSHLLPQVQAPRRFDDERFFDGLLLILSGLFRKCVVADNCALIANAAFGGRLGAPNLPIVLLGTYAFAWQIYGDFSGYSDIARGAAQLLGFHFAINFRQPYLATRLSEFWRRWHISLSSWIRDYVYMNLRFTYRNLLLTMLLCGLWHGANWTFVLWGGIHGAIMAAERFITRLRGAAITISQPGPIRTWIQRILFFHLLCVTWIFFRANSLSSALQFLSGLSVLSWSPIYWTAFKFLAFFALPLLVVDLVNEKAGTEYLLQNRSPMLRVATGLSVWILLILFTANQGSTFVYFQF
jgi:D-alanyl-lipoteichoic acid acyltransferase DltB (MBOAT superfamily)